MVSREYEERRDQGAAVEAFAKHVIKEAEGAGLNILQIK